jgi:aminoglycoside phosphotransferase (APT) family kinase protein
LAEWWVSGCETQYRSWYRCGVTIGHAVVTYRGARIHRPLLPYRDAVEVPPDIAPAVAALEPGGQLVGIHALTGGVSADVFGLEIATAAGGRRRAVFRQHRDVGFKGHGRTVMAKEHRVLTALHAGGLAVPEPYLYAVGVDMPYLLMAWIDGSTDVGSDDLPGALDQMARFLATVHGLDDTALRFVALETIEDPRATAGPLLPRTDLGRRVREQLAARVGEPERNRRVLLHGDYWPGNVMWQDGRLAAVLDWEDACVGDPLADLATARVELLCQYGEEATARFTAAYVEAYHEVNGPLSLEALPVWEVYVSAGALMSMAEWGLDPVAEAHRRLHTTRFFEEAAGRLD